MELVSDKWRLNFDQKYLIRNVSHHQTQYGIKGEYLEGQPIDWIEDG